jgi:methionyl aminopeptidase
MAMTKTSEEIAILRKGGALLSKALGTAVSAVKPGVSIKELNALAEKVIRDGGAEPSFLGYKSSPDDTPFPSAVCVSVNEEVVHGLGNRDRILQEGDIVGFDLGLWLDGLCTDMAVTVPVGTVSEEAKKLMQVTREALMKGVEAVKVGGYISDVGRAVEAYVKPYGYGIVRALVGHGVGHEVHEPPHIPNYVSHSFPEVKILNGMCLALEPMLSLGGDWRVDTAEDGWAIVISDGSLSAHFEVTIAVTNEGVEILTPLPV